MENYRKIITWVALALGAFLPLSSAEAYPSAGRDEFKSAAVIEADLSVIGGPRISLTLVGPTRIVRSDPFDPGDGREMIIAEIVAMDLRGESPLGPVEIRESGEMQSMGVIRQKEPGVDFPANSFFDVFIEVVTSLGAFRNQDPIRLGAMINAIPPFQAQYMPEGTFDGVDLFDFNGNKVGTIRHAVHFVGQRPSFSVAPMGPSGLDPADIFDVPRSEPGIPGTTGLGLEAGDDLDGLSYGIDFIADFMEMRFSVDPNSQGVPGSMVRTEFEKAVPEAHGDEFWTSGANVGTNAQELDENGDSAPPFPLRISDDVDALTEPPTSFADPDGDEIPENPVYFSLGVDSPSLSALGVNPGDILETSDGGPPEVFIPARSLNLSELDDLDAFCLVRTTRTVLFSLAPGSPTLASGGFSAADLFLAINAQGPPAPSSPPDSLPRRFVRASQLGLLEEDNLNALKCTVVEVDHFHHSLLSFLLSDREERIFLWGPTKTLVAVGPNGEAQHSSAGYDFVGQELAVLSMVGSDGQDGTITATNRVPREPGDPFSRGIIRDRPTDGVEDVPNRLDTRPWGRGQADTFLDLVLNFRRDGRTLHNRQPIQLFGVITEKPPAPEEFLRQVAASTSSAPATTSKALTPAWPPPLNPGFEKLDLYPTRNQEMPGIELLARISNLIQTSRPFGGLERLYS